MDKGKQKTSDGSRADADIKIVNSGLNLRDLIAWLLHPLWDYQMFRFGIRSLLVLTAATVALIVGCTYPVVENPLILPDKCEKLPQLHGAFKMQNRDSKKNSYLHIGSAGDKFPAGFLQIVIVQQPDDERPLGATSFVAFAEPVADSYIIHIPLPEDSNLEQQLNKLEHKWDVSKVASYTLLRLTKTKTGFSIFLLDEDFLASQIQADQLAGRVEQNVNKATDPPTVGRRTTRITAGTAELRQYFDSTRLDKLFEKSGFPYDELK